MQLNQLAPEPGGGGSTGGADLVVNQDELGAVEHEAFILHDHLHAQADIVGAGADKRGSGSTMQAATAFNVSNFEMGSASRRPSVSGRPRSIREFNRINHLPASWGD
ncbi:hypothetical protein [Streptomyces sp. NBC_01445]|uniref:hypothetical protein n=1 Tax=Streptomyces sp. NBC_01445 TaxID=2903869 RepID=UPI002DDB6D78|nr:hypothetical protein [Streptomyces sp. NBC_01445]WSE04781.1 hypothetical protein OG574_16285 [Streptomyces sp. NBC_01445]